MSGQGFREPNVCVTAAEAAWLEVAAEMLRGKDATDRERRKAAVYVAKVARDARRATPSPRGGEGR